MDERKRRIGQNEILYRAVNEKIEGVNAAFGTLVPWMTVVCECGDGACTEQIELDVSTYERVRAEPTLFVVRPGHEFADVEDIVEQAEGYDIVRKRAGGPQELAEQHDPRADD
jgi:hypothetical protein